MFTNLQVGVERMIRRAAPPAAPVQFVSRRNSHPLEAADVYDVLRYADEYDRA
jgi:hypothetical protein